MRRVDLREYAGEGKTSIPFDPAHPVASNGGRYTNTCVQNQTVRDGVVSFTSPPLEEPLDITGNVRARLYVASDADAADFIVTLIDVHPDGYAMPVADGQVRARKPGEADIDLGPTSNLFEAGHRIRDRYRRQQFPQAAAEHGAFREHGLARQDSIVLSGTTDCLKIIRGQTERFGVFLDAKSSSSPILKEFGRNLGRENQETFRLCPYYFETVG